MGLCLKEEVKDGGNMMFPALLGFTFGIASSYQDAKTLTWEVRKSGVFILLAFIYWALKGSLLLSALGLFMGLFFGAVGYVAKVWDHEDVAIIGAYSAVTPVLHDQIAIFPILGNLILLLLPIQLMKIEKFPLGPFIFEAWIIAYLVGNVLFKVLGWYG